MKHQVIDSASGLQALSKFLLKEPSVAVDLESDSMYHYREKVCLIQLSTNKAQMIVDPLKIEDFSSLRPVFADSRIKKVFHGADYDIRSLYRDFGIEVNNLLDTQMAATFLGMESTSLDAVLLSCFNIQLDKKYQKKDWSLRPLPEDMLNYALMDVKYLLPLGDELVKRLKKSNRLQWVEEECVLLSGVRPAEQYKAPLFLKFKGAGKLDSRSLAILEFLLRYRNQIAKKKDKPLFKIFRNASLMKIALSQPKNMSQLADSGALSTKQIEMYGNGVLKAVDKGLKLPIRRLPSYPMKKANKMNTNVPKRIRALKAWRNKKAEQLHLPPPLICSNAIAGVLANRNPKTLTALKSIRELKNWQVAEFGKEIIETLV